MIQEKRMVLLKIPARGNAGILSCLMPGIAIRRFGHWRNGCRGGSGSVWAYEIVFKGIAAAVFVIYILTMYF